MLEMRHNRNNKIYQIRLWSKRLTGYPCFVLGNGPSILNYDLSLLNKFFTIGINRIFFLFDPTILFWQDIGLWNDCRKKILRLKSIKVATKDSDPKCVAVRFNAVDANPAFLMKPYKLYGRGNSGVLAVQMAVALGCSPIVLFGFDGRCINGKTDFYGDNEHHNCRTMRMSMKYLKWIKKKCPVPVVNCSDNGLWEKTDISSILSNLNEYKKGRKFYQDNLKN